MVLNLKHRSLSDFAAMSAQDMNAIVVRATDLETALRDGTAQSPLRGLNLGLLCDTDGNAEAALFQRAASALGAQVAHLHPKLSELSSPQEVQDTARILGRLYDAVECVGMAPALVGRIGVEAGVPVFDGIASPRHPTAWLAGLLRGGAGHEEDRRCLVIQAVLLGALA